MEVGIH